MRSANEEREKRFERLFAETRADLLAYALRRAGSPDEAADVLAETFLIAWRKLDSVPAGAEARLWLFGVARNILRRGARRRAAMHDAVQQLALELREAAPPIEEETRPSRLRAALQALPAPQREVILLTAWEELSPREIAIVTGLPVNLVRVRLHRARRRLRQELSAEDARAPTEQPPPSTQGERRREIRARTALDSTVQR